MVRPPGSTKGPTIADPEIVEWLLAGDLAIKWQVQRDLQDLPETVWGESRRWVAVTGWGAELLSHRDPDGTWGGHWYSPKWISTFYSMQLLVILGVADDSPPVVETGRLMLARGVQGSGGVSWWRNGVPDTCVTGMLLSMASSIGLAAEPACRSMVDWLLAEQMDDGGWNCDRGLGATHGSFHTTLSVLEGLRLWGSLTPSDRRMQQAASRGREFLLDHRLYRSHTTGRVARPTFTEFSFPHWWYYDVLRALDYFRSASTTWDDRLTDAVALVESRQRPDGSWNLQNRHRARTWFEMEEPGRASRWNTLRALRVLRWAQQAQGAE